MTYAIISDIHGNFPALEATLAHARANGADEYILIGDYTCRIPWDNEVVNAIRNLSPAHVIRGNGEGHYLNMQKIKTSIAHEQFKPLSWSYNKITPENLSYLLALPEAMTILHEGIDIHLAHSIDFLFNPGVIDFFHTIQFNNRMRASPITHQEYLVLGKEAVLSYALDNVLALPKGIYLSGHNHLQFFMEHEGRVFINPGSCGMPADWDPRTSYTLLAVNGKLWEVEERRVTYDTEATAAGLITTGFHHYAPIWSEAIQMQILTGKEYFGWLVTHIDKTKKRLGQAAPPSEVWNKAVKTWDIKVL